MSLQLNYIIGHEYKYHSHKQKYKLKSVDRWVYIFDCGHRVTDCVFMDLIDCSTGIPVYKNNQLEIWQLT